MSSYRVRDDDDVEAFGMYLIAKVGKSWRVYEDGSYYSSTSGGVIKKGKVALGLDGCALNFKSKKSAEDWIAGGMRLTDDCGNELEL